MVDTVAEGTLSDVRRSTISLAAHDDDGVVQPLGLCSLRRVGDDACRTEARVCDRCFGRLSHGQLPHASLVHVDAGLPPPDLPPELLKQWTSY